jgi:rhodanese-related sulfurtransferase
MNKTYIIIAAIFVILAGILLFLPERKYANEVNPDQLLLSLEDKNRFISPEEAADLMIHEDPSVFFIDLRSPQEYDKFSLPNAINYPLESLLDEDVMDLLSREDLRFILYGNGDLTAEKAWVLLRRKNLKNSSILKGGLNEFTKTIFAAEAPGEGADARAHELFSLRQAIALYLGGGSIELEPDEVSVQKTYSSSGTKSTDAVSKTGTSVTPIKVTPKKVVPKKVKKKVEEEEEGC